jgi:hypothetical protein
MNNKYLIFGVIIFILLVAIFLYYKYKKYDDYLTIVPNPVVSTKQIPKTYYKLIFSNITGLSQFNSKDTLVVTTINKTGKTIDSPSGANTGIPGTGKSFYIYNNSPDSFNILGTTLIAVATKNASNKIDMKIGSKSGDSLAYNGSKISINKEYQIEYINISEYVLNRLTVICNNTTSRSLYIYFLYNNKYYGIIVNNLQNDILIIDLYNNP